MDTSLAAVIVPFLVALMGLIILKTSDKNEEIIGPSKPLLVVNVLISVFSLFAALLNVALFLTTNNMVHLCVGLIFVCSSVCWSWITWRRLNKIIKEIKSGI